jgi:hypothetical protein
MEDTCGLSSRSITDAHCLCRCQWYSYVKAYISKPDEPVHFYGNPTLVQYTPRGLSHLTIQPLWEVVKRGTVVFLPVSVILDI